MPDVRTVLFLLAAGGLAGLVSSVVSLASLVSYPALLALGVPPVAANVTNTVGLVLSGVGSAVGSRRELVGQGRRVLRLGLATGLGGGLGAALLLLAPAESFEAVVPVLVVAASAAMLLPARTGGGPGRGRRWPAVLGFAAAAVYIGYFGAAGGVLLLAALDRLVPEPLVRVNALKNVLGGLANLVAALGFAALGPVRWDLAVPLALGFLVGGWTGPAIARRLPGRGLRLLVACSGIGMGVWLGITTYG